MGADTSSHEISLAIWDVASPLEANAPVPDRPQLDLLPKYLAAWQVSIADEFGAFSRQQFET